MTPDFAAIRERAEHYRPRIVRFLRDLIALPSPSGDEERVVGRIREEMEDLGYDRVEFDPLGNVLGYLGSGPRLVALDGHVDTVGVGNRDLWAFDPYEGFEDEACVGGRGASDQKGGVASAVWAGKIIRDLGLLPSDVTLLVTGTVQEEDCDGLCWQYLIREHGVRPEFVLSTEPTSCRIYRGHRGRMEIKVSVSGVSCHGSAPERGDNAIYKMAPILEELQGLHGRLAEHPFLGKGSLAVSEIWSSSPSRCAVADGCGISVDRRLTLGETAESALGEIRDLPAVRAARGAVEMYDYAAPSWRGGGLSHGGLFPHLAHRRRSPRDPGRGAGPSGALSGRTGGGQVDLLHQWGGHHGTFRHPLHRLRPGARRPGPRPQRAHLEGRAGGRRRALRRSARHPGRPSCSSIPLTPSFRFLGAFHRS